MRHLSFIFIQSKDFHLVNVQPTTFLLPENQPLGSWLWFQRDSTGDYRRQAAISLMTSQTFARFIRTVCMRRIRRSCKGLTSVHNEYTGYTLMHLLPRHMYNLSLLALMCYLLKLGDSETFLLLI